MNYLGIITLFSSILIPIDSKKSYCEIVREDIKECTHLCDEESRDQRKSKLKLPQCGLTSFGIKSNTRMVGGKDLTLCLTLNSKIIKFLLESR